MAADSKVQHYLQVLLKQAGINQDMTIGQVMKIFEDAEKASKVDSQLEAPFYNQAKLSFQRLSRDGHTVLMTCKPAAVKLLLVLAEHANQSNIICISKSDLATIADMSKPTINTASNELIYKGLMIIERGNEGQGEAITYILNPQALASGKIIYHKSLLYHYWERAGAEAQQRFTAILKQRMHEFDKEFQVEDVTIRGETEPQAKVTKRGKQISQKKSVSAGHTDTVMQSTQGSTTINQDNNKQHTAENQEKSRYAFNMQNGLTEQELQLFSQDEPPENPAYSIHNDTDTKEE